MIAIPTASAPASSVCAPDTVRRILYLDSLRGICAFVVAVFWHYRHFSALFQPRSMALPNAPYYTLFPFSLCYRYGYAAVDVFFLLSGFVFSYVYAQSIASGQVGPARFFANRFSRLYPLHLATLLYVALVVYVYTSLYHAVPIYQHNDLYHFLLNAWFMQKGLFDRDLSFNGPAWSLSIEGFLYVAFFMLARRRLGLFWPSAGIRFSLIVLVCRLHHRFLLNEEMARGAGGFFSGMVLFQAIDRKQWGLLLLPLTLIACDAMIILI